MTAQDHLDLAASDSAPAGKRLILNVADLEAHHGKNRIVKGISFTIEEGEFVTLLGPSGCGKTTTLRCVAGLHRASGGTIQIDGRAVDDGRLHVRPEHRGLNMVFQSYALWPHMSVFQNIAYGLRAQRVPRSEIAPRVDEVLGMVGLSGYGGRSAAELSGGQQQRVVLARGLATHPRLLLLDEPLSNLDSELRGRMRAEIHALQRRLGFATLYVTHDRTEALALSDKVIVMREGVIQQIGRPDELYATPRNRFVAEALGPVSAVPAVVVDAGEQPVARLVGTSTEATMPIAADVHECRPGQEIDLLLRPEALTVATDRGGALVGAFEGTVELVEFLGNRTEVTVRSGDHVVRVDMDGRAPEVEFGKRVQVGLHPGRGYELPSWQPRGSADAVVAD